MTVADWLFGVLVVSVVAVLCLGALVGHLDLSTRRSRIEALLGSIVLGGGFFALTGAWMGLCIPTAALILVSSGLARVPQRPM